MRWSSKKGKQTTNTPYLCWPVICTVIKRRDLPMTSKDKRLKKAAELLRRAEEIDLMEAAFTPDTLENLSLEEIRQTLHDLRVYRIDLEMQNEELRRTMVELDAMQTRYLDLYDQAPVGYCTVSEKGLIQEVNLTASTLLGVTRGALVGKPITRFIHKEDQDVYCLNCKKLFANDTPKVFELRMVKKDATSFWVRLNVTLSPDSVDTPECRIVLSDITDYKQKEEALPESEEQFRKLFEGHSAVKLIIDADTGGIIYANQAAVKFYGWSVNKLKQMHIQEINDLSPEIANTEIEKILLSEASSSEFRHRRADGSSRDVEVFSNKIEIAGKSFLYLIIHDISERKLAEAALKESEARFRTLADAIPQLCWSANAEGWLLWYNQRWYEYTGMTPKQMEGWGWQSVHDPEVLPQVLERWQASIRTCKPFEMVFPLRGSDGVYRSFLTRGMPIYDLDGKVVHWFGTNTDITEREQVEEELRRSEERYRSLFNLMLEGFCIIEVQFDENDHPVDYLFLEINPVFEAQTGLHDVQGKLIRELAPEQEEYWFEIYGRVALTGESIRFVNEAKALNRWFDVSAYRIGGQDSRKVAILFNDISELKRAEAVLKKTNEELESRVLQRTQDLAVLVEKLQLEIADREKVEESVVRLNRLYAVLSQVSHTIVWTKDQNILFEEFCRIAIEEGSFKLAWVGLVDEESGALKVVASAGATRYMEELKISVKEEPAGLGPTGISVREGTYYICNDFLDSPITRPWHDRGRAHGIRASASIALKQGERVIGALTLYADQKDFFDQQHVELLQQMGAEVSFAMDIFAQEARRKEGELALRAETAVRIRVEEEIRTLNVELEQRVIERTTELIVAHKEAQKTNERLRHVIEARKQAEKALRVSEKQLLVINSELEQRVERRTRELQETQINYLHAEKLSAIGKLSASIAHEFNNPLQGIMSILKGLKKRAILEDEDRELLDAAVIESERMKSLICNLQDFNRPSTGRKVVMDVQKSIDSVLLLQKSDFKTKRISLVLNFAGQLPQILGIPDQIKQVLLNLLTNAADALQHRGGVITVSTWQEDQKIFVSIKDNGVGIKPEEMDRIFQPFFTTKPSVKGTGLGLSICHGIVKSHHGEIRVESLPGEGTTLTVLLPIKG